jgi:tetratricopeptide (TPR) repeat protein
MRAVAFYLLPLLVFAQHHEMAPPSEKPVTLYKGLGAWRHSIATSNPEAQKYFDQGLALLYGFNRYESLRSFRKAAELDPSATMAYWGMAMSQGPYINMDGDPSVDLKGSCGAVMAGRKTANAPPRERAYLEAAASWCPEYKPETYIAAAKRLAADYPDDLDAQTLYAESLMIPVRWHWYAADGTPATGMLEAEHVLEEVLRRWPAHPGANHYYIHAVESSRTPERAIPSAQRLMGVVPWAGHMVHMPAHIWLRTGDYELAATLNERASAVDREYVSASNVTIGSYTPYYAHNLHFVAYARWMQGRQAEAIKAGDAVAAAMTPMAEMAPDMADAFAAQALFARIRTQAWTEVLKMKEPSEKMVCQAALLRYGRALALRATGDRAGAAREQTAFEAARAKVPADRGFGLSKAADILTIAAEILSARMSANSADELRHWRKAVEIQDTLTYDEPPDWYYPVRESLGAALVRAGRAAEGEKVFRDALARSPRNGFVLLRSDRIPESSEETGRPRSTPARVRIGLVQASHQANARQSLTTTRRPTIRVYRRSPATNS